MRISEFGDNFISEFTTSLHTNPHIITTFSQTQIQGCNLVIVLYRIYKFTVETTQ